MLFWGPCWYSSEFFAAQCVWFCSSFGNVWGMISILRGSFDIILPCVLDAAGRCKLPPQMSGDMEKLEKMLGSRVAGANLKDLLAGEETLSWNCLKLLEITQNWSYFKSFSGCTSMLRKTNPISLPMSEMWFAKQIALKEVRCLCRPRAFGLALLDLCPQLPRCCTAT